MARYKDALQWITDNDDTMWLRDDNGYLSVTAAMVADLFGKTDDQVKRDLLRLEDLRVKRAEEQADGLHAAALDDATVEETY